MDVLDNRLQLLLKRLDKITGQDTALPCLQMYTYFSERLRQLQAGSLTRAERTQTLSEAAALEANILSERKVVLAAALFRTHMSLSKLQSPPVFRGGSLMSALGFGWSNPDYKLDLSWRKEKEEEYRRLRRRFDQALSEYPLEREQVESAAAEIDHFTNAVLNDKTGVTSKMS